MESKSNGYRYLKCVAIGTTLGYVLLKLARKRQEEFIASLPKDKQQAMKERQIEEEKAWKQAQEHFLNKK